MQILEMRSLCELQLVSNVTDYELDVSHFNETCQTFNDQLMQFYITDNFTASKGRDGWDMTLSIPVERSLEMPILDANVRGGGSPTDIVSFPALSYDTALDSRSVATAQSLACTLQHC